MLTLHYNKLFFLIILVLIIGLSQGCGTTPNKEKQFPVCPVGVKPLSDVIIESSQSYSYSIDQGRLAAKNRVKSLALQEASESYRLRVISELKSSIICTTRKNTESCNEKIKHIMQLTSDNLVDKVETKYQDISSNKICVTARVHFRDDFSEQDGFSEQQDEIPSKNENEGNGETEPFIDPLYNGNEGNGKTKLFIDPLNSDKISPLNDNDNEDYPNPLNSRQID